MAPGALHVSRGSSSLPSFHVGSGCPDLHAYAQSIADARLVFEMGAELGHRMHLLDLGGGFPGLEGAKVRFEEVTLGYVGSGDGVLRAVEWALCAACCARCFSQIILLLAPCYSRAN